MHNIETIRQFANQNPSAWVATSVDNRPHVRGMFMWFADESGFYFHTGTHKRLYEQLMTNPSIEIAFSNPGENFGEAKMVRIGGEIEFVDDESLHVRLFQERPWLNQVAKAFPEAKVKVFRISSGEAQYWDFGVNGHEKEQEAIRF